MAEEREEIIRSNQQIMAYFLQKNGLFLLYVIGRVRQF